MIWAPRTLVSGPKASQHRQMGEIKERTYRWVSRAKDHQLGLLALAVFKGRCHHEIALLGTGHMYATRATPIGTSHTSTQALVANSACLDSKKKFFFS